MFLRCNPRGFLFFSRRASLFIDSYYTISCSWLDSWISSSVGIRRT